MEIKIDCFEKLDMEIDELIGKRHELQQDLSLIDELTWDYDLEYFECLQGDLFSEEEKENFKTITYDVAENVKKELENVELNIAYRLNSKIKRQINKLLKEKEIKQAENDEAKKLDTFIEEECNLQDEFENELKNDYELVMSA